MNEETRRCSTKGKMQTIFRQIRSANEEIKYVNVMNDTYNVY